ncbi:hypothetical protein CPB86DRAFT_869567 [Serendipita vermifera]|nr:hypothetical protein CPB86DRAFT_869567 [Serendipita vermifera]
MSSMVELTMHDHDMMDADVMVLNSETYMDLTQDNLMSRNAFPQANSELKPFPWPIRLLQTVVSSGVKRRRASLEEDNEEEEVKRGENTMRILKKRILSLDGLQERQGSKISEQELKSQRLSLAQSLCAQYNLNERDAQEVKSISQRSPTEMMSKLLALNMARDAELSRAQAEAEMDTPQFNSMIGTRIKEYMCDPSLTSYGSNAVVQVMYRIRIDPAGWGLTSHFIGHQTNETKLANILHAHFEVSRNQLKNSISKSIRCEQSLNEILTEFTSTSGLNIPVTEALCERFSFLRLGFIDFHSKLTSAPDLSVMNNSFGLRTSSGEFKIVSEEEIQQFQQATLNGGIKGFAYGLGLSLPGSFLLQRYSRTYRAIPLPLKAFGVVMVTIPTTVILAERAGLRYDHERYSQGSEELERARAQKNAELQKLKQMSTLERGKQFVNDHKYSVILSSWAGSMLGAWAIINRDKYMTFSQKIVQVRMWAQGVTIAMIIGTALLSQADRQKAREHPAVDHSWMEHLNQSPEQAKTPKITTA